MKEQAQVVKNMKDQILLPLLLAPHQNHYPLNKNDNLIRHHNVSHYVLSATMSILNIEIRLCEIRIFVHYSLLLLNSKCILFLEMLVNGNINHLFSKIFENKHWEYEDNFLYFPVMLQVMKCWLNLLLCKTEKLHFSNRPKGIY